MDWISKVWLEWIGGRGGGAADLLEGEELRLALRTVPGMALEEERLRAWRASAMARLIIGASAPLPTLESLEDLAGSGRREELERRAGERRAALAALELREGLEGEEGPLAREAARELEGELLAGLRLDLEGEEGELAIWRADLAPKDRRAALARVRWGSVARRARACRSALGIHSAAAAEGAPAARRTMEELRRAAEALLEELEELAGAAPDLAPARRELGELLRGGLEELLWGGLEKRAPIRTMLPRLEGLERYEEEGGRSLPGAGAMSELLEGLERLEDGLRWLEDEPDPKLARALRLEVGRARARLIRARLSAKIRAGVGELRLLEGDLTPAQRAELRLRERALLAAGGELEEELERLAGAALLAPLGKLEGLGLALVKERLRAWRDRDLRGGLAPGERLLLRTGAGGGELRLLAALLRKGSAGDAERERLAGLVRGEMEDLALEDLAEREQDDAPSLLAALVRLVCKRARGEHLGWLEELRRQALEELELLPILRAAADLPLDLEDLCVLLSDSDPAGTRMELKELRELIPMLRAMALELE